MARSGSYNGHPSYNAWNVSLWLNNDEPLYRMAVAAKRRYGTGVGARMLMAMLPPSTPDGVPYRVTNVRRVLADLD